MVIKTQKLKKIIRRGSSLKPHFSAQTSGVIGLSTILSNAIKMQATFSRGRVRFS